MFISKYVLVILLIVALAGGFGIGVLVSERHISTLEKEVTAFRDQFSLTLDPSGRLVASQYLSGTITSLDRNTLRIMTRTTPSSAMTEKNVELTDTTQIFQMVQKDQVMFEKELEEFRMKHPPLGPDGQSPPSPAVSLMPPQLSEKKPVDRTALIEGKSVAILLEAGSVQEEVPKVLSIEVSDFSATPPAVPSS